MSSKKRQRVSFPDDPVASEHHLQSSKHSRKNDEDSDEEDKLDVDEMDFKKNRTKLREHDDDDEEEDEDDLDEDDKKSRRRMAKDAIEGEEEINHSEYQKSDTGYKLTPFNMKEELETGEMDEEGNYYEKKQDVSDAWADSLNWSTDVHKVGKYSLDGDEDGDASDGDEAGNDQSSAADVDANKSEEQLLDELIHLLHEKETVYKALKRLGGAKKPRTAKEKRLAQQQHEAHPADLSSSNKAKLNRLTELADTLLRRGNMTIYDDAREQLVINLQRTAATSLDDAVHWQYKFEDSDTAALYGPFTTQQMQEWKESNAFADQMVLVRQIGKHDFYPLARVDFDLYD